jgi:hypothetical protein
MTRISSSEQVLLLLRERLQRLDRGKAGRSGAAGARGSTASPLVRLQGLAALDELPSEELRRTLVRALLSEELGEEVAIDPSFQAVSDEVYRMIGESEQGRALMDAAEKALREKN